MIPYLHRFDPHALGTKLIPVVLKGPGQKLRSDYPMFELQSPGGRADLCMVSGFIPWDSFRSRAMMLQWTIPLAMALFTRMREQDVESSGKHLELPRGIDIAETVIGHGAALRVLVTLVPAQAHVPWWQTAKVQKFYDVRVDEHTVGALLPAISLGIGTVCKTTGPKPWGSGHLPGLSYLRETPQEEAMRVTGSRVLETLSENSNDHSGAR